jgi:Glyoxalase-like domain
MAYDFQVVVDCASPHMLADWWAETLDWVVEEQDESFIRRMIAEGHATPDDTVNHNGKLVWATGAAVRRPDGEAAGERKRILFQQVPEPKTAKNRLHLDVFVGAEHVQAVAGKLTERGASYLHDGQQGPHRWITLADPEGNEFCLS